jgi:O-antigen/teichoic acid export membrane protein
MSAVFTARIRRVWTSSFIRQSAVLMSGTVMAQVIVFACAPILTRIYLPSQFGEFATFTALIAIFGGFVTGQYEMAIVLPKVDSRARDIFYLGLIIAIVLSSVAFVAIVGIRSITLLRGTVASSALIYLVPLSLFLVGLVNLGTYWNIRTKSFAGVSSANVVQSTSTSLIQIALGLSGWGVWGLAAGFISGQISSIAVLLSRFFAKLRITSHLRIFAVAQRYKGFPQYMLVAGLVSRITANLPLLVFSWYFPSDVTGRFALSQRVIQTPVAIIGVSVSNVFLQRASVLGKIDPVLLRRDAARMVISLLALGAVPTMILILAAPMLFAFIFGVNWVEAGRYTQLLAFYLWLQLAFSPLSIVFSALERQRLYQTWEWLRLLLCTVGLFVGASTLNPDTVIICYSLAMTAGYLILGFLAFRVMGQTARRFQSQAELPS